jgi:caffeoyl-CoA O-methyltransferase
MARQRSKEAAVGFLEEGVSSYLTGLAEQQHTTSVLEEMEAHADEHGFPIVGRAVGRLLELVACAVGAGRVMELGSGYGYSAYWFARAVGIGGEVVCTDGDADNAVRAERYLTEAGLWDRVRFQVGDALQSFAVQEGDFDVVYCDVDKHGYPDCWRAASDRIRVGGLYVCDNVLWSGDVVTGQDREGRQGWTAAIQEHNRLVAADDRYVSSIAPIRDGVMLALRIR